jgi:nuclear pore complex protein Nup155
MLRHAGHDSFETSAHHRTPQRNREQEAQLEEKHSLDALKVFVAHTCEVLGMWRVLSEHQFHVVADTLTKVRELSRNMYSDIHEVKRGFHCNIAVHHLAVYNYDKII